MIPRRESSPGRAARDVLVEADGGPPRAGVVLFHGGALRRGEPGDLEHHCRALARSGILAASFGYRLLGRGAGSLDDCLDDVRSGIRRFTDHAGRRGSDPSHIATGGSSAGAHLAMVAAMSAPPGAAPSGPVVAFNPAGFRLTQLPVSERRTLAAEVGVTVQHLADVSLLDLVRPGLPDMMIQHGTHDEVEPIDAVRLFRDAMVAAGNRCTVHEYPGRGHGFHYPRPGNPFDEVIAATVRFLLAPTAAVRTPRLVLTPVGVGDLDELAVLYDDPQVAHWTGPWTRDTVSAWVTDMVARWERDGVGKWTARRSSDGSLVGRGGFSRLAWGSESVLELGWAVRDALTGKGYATEIGRAAIAWAAVHHPVLPVVAFTEVHNRASRAVMERLGLRWTSTIRRPGLVEGRTGIQPDAPFALYRLP